MSGQSNVDDKTVADTAKARADATNSAPVVRRRPVPVVAVVIGIPPSRQLYSVQRLYAVQEEVKVGRWRGWQRQFPAGGVHDGRRPRTRSSTQRSPCWTRAEQRR